MEVSILLFQLNHIEIMMLYFLLPTAFFKTFIMFTSGLQFST